MDALRYFCSFNTTFVTVLWILPINGRQLLYSFNTTFVTVLLKEEIQKEIEKIVSIQLLLLFYIQESQEGAQQA